MQGFFLGRSTPQWLSIIGGTLTFIGVLIQLTKPELTGQYVIVSGAVVVLANYYLAFLTNSGTTPTADARLLAGSSLTAVDKNGISLGSVQLPSEDELKR